MSLELLRRARLDGYSGGKSALYDLVKELRPNTPRPVVRGPPPPSAGDVAPAAHL